MSELSRFGVSMELPLLQKFDELIARKGYSNRSEAIRDLVREMISRESVSAPACPTVGSLTLIFSRHAHRLTDKLTDIQHRHHELVLATLHTHLDEHSCLETLVLRGAAGEVRALAAGLIATKGVTHGQLTIFSAPEAERSHHASQSPSSP